MKKHDKSKFGRLFEESLKEANYNSDQFIQDKSTAYNDNVQLFDRSQFIETIISLDNLNDYINNNAFKQDSVSYKEYLKLQKMHTRCFSFEYVDLHNEDSTLSGLNTLNIFFKNSYGKTKYLKIIHGKGHHNKDNSSPMRAMVRKFLLNTSIVLAFCEAELKDGGDGATYVLIKK
tara:strand:+ start:268 stop:792 length:525 start_codon:yes stop_codon:yes gene_type:complete